MRLILIALFSLTSLVWAEVDRTKKPEPGPAPTATFPDYVTKDLPNGLKVFVIHDDRKPTVSFHLLLKAGDSRDGDKPGTADFVASMLNRGTTTMDADAIAQAVDFIGAEVEAGSGPDSLSVSAGGLTKYTDKLLAIMSDVVLHPTFPADQFKKLQRRTLSGLIAAKRQPSALAGKMMRKVLFGEHPYGEVVTPESVMSLTPGDLKKYHETWFAPNIASLAVVGDVQAADILPKIEKAFGGWEKKEVPAEKKVSVPQVKGLSIHLVDLSPSVQSNIIVARVEPPRNFPDLPEVNVMSSTLGGGFSGRLFQNLRETHGYTYGSSCAFGYNADAGYFQATAETRNDVTAPAIQEILKEITRIRETDIPPAELALQRQYNVGNYLLSLENAGRVASRVQDIWLYGLAPDFYKTYAARMAAVTPEKAKELAQKYLSAEDVAIIVVGEAREIQPALEKIGKVTVYDTDLKPVKGNGP